MTIIKRIVNKIRYEVYRAYKLKVGKKYRLIKQPAKEFQLIHTVQGKSWNTMYTPEIFELSKERTIVAIYPEFEFYKIDGATINTDSDVVLSDKGAWWDKYNDEDFATLAKPADTNVVTYNSETVTIFPAKQCITLKGKVLSLVGVYSYAWSHFLFEFVCKMFFAGEVGLLDQEITLLTNEYDDENIEYILANYLQKYTKVKRVRAKRQTDYNCEELYAIRCTGTNYNEAKVFWDYRLVIPEIVTRKLHEYISAPLIKKIQNKPVRYKKLFLARHTNRILTNNDEVETYFKNEGFHFVTGSELSLEDKVDLFYHADIIVGLHSSAWQNIIFCKDARCLMLVNNRYAPEMGFYSMAKENVKRWINVCGRDVDDSRRSDFYVPLEKIKRAYSQLLTD